MHLLKTINLVQLALKEQADLSQKLLLLTILMQVRDAIVPQDLVACKAERILLIYNWAVLCEKDSLKSQKRPTRKVFVYKIQVNPIHMVIIMALWIGNGAVFKSSILLQLTEF